jgi:hypothetical protein
LEFGGRGLALASRFGHVIADNYELLVRQCDELIKRCHELATMNRKLELRAFLMRSLDSI